MILYFCKPESVGFFNKSRKILHRSFTVHTDFKKTHALQTYSVVSYMWDIYIQRPSAFNEVMKQNHMVLKKIYETLYWAKQERELESEIVNDLIQELIYPLFVEFNNMIVLLDIDPSKRFKK